MGIAGCCFYIGVIERSLHEFQVSGLSKKLGSHIVANIVVACP